MFQIALDRLISRPTAIPNAARVERYVRYMSAGMDLGPIQVINQQAAPGESRLVVSPLLTATPQSLRRAD
jgi:hypothetical protein